MNGDISCIRTKSNIASYRYLPSFASYNEQTSASTDHLLPIAFHSLKEQWQYICIIKSFHFVHHSTPYMYVEK